MTRYVLRAFDKNGCPHYYVCRPGDKAISPNYRDAYVYATASDAAAAMNYINHSAEDNPTGIWFVRLPYVKPFVVDDERKRVADRIDGYDRDDLGDSPDY